MDEEHVKNKGNGEIIGSYIALYGMNVFAFTWIFFPKYGFLYLACLITSSIALHFLTKDAFADYKKNYEAISEAVLLAKVNKEKIKHSRVSAILTRMLIMTITISITTNVALIIFNCPLFIRTFIVPVFAGAAAYFGAEMIIKLGYYPHQARNNVCSSENFSDRITSDISCGITPPGHNWDSKH